MIKLVLHVLDEEHWDVFGSDGRQHVGLHTPETIMMVPTVIYHRRVPLS